MGYANFLRRNWRFLSFGLLFTFGSSFGQTFFVSLFGAELRAEFGLSHGDFGALYSAATLASAATLVWVGRHIDRIDLRLYAGLVGTTLAAACLFLSVVQGLVALALAIYVLRFAGQGLMSHVSATSMARYFDADRGKAMSIASLGMPLGEGFLPLATVALIGALGWRPSLLSIGLAVAVILVPAALWLLRGHGARHSEMMTRNQGAGAGPGAVRRQWTRGEVVRDKRFYMLLPAVVASPFLMTGFLFHQVHLASAKGWSLTWLATCFLGFAAAKVAASLVLGPLVDRFGARRLLPWALPVLALAFLVLAIFDHPSAAVAYMTVAGLNVGASVTIGGALWPELYGVIHLGAIRAMTAAIMVLSTAVAPVSMGWLIDRGVGIETLASLGVAYVLASAVLAIVALGINDGPLSADGRRRR
ncbi:MAG: MFS transporter [Alphaproteobacteria bacterium]